jgi:hypothetical protein
MELRVEGGTLSGWLSSRGIGHTWQDDAVSYKALPLDYTRMFGFNRFLDDDVLVIHQLARWKRNRNCPEHSLFIGWGFDSIHSNGETSVP